MVGGRLVPPPKLLMRLLPAGDLEDRALAGYVVLDADEQACAGGIEDAPSPLSAPVRNHVVERCDTNAAVAQQIR